MSAALKLSLALVACAALLIVAGGAAAAPPRPETHTVVMEAVAFQPADLTVKAGDTVVWTNKDPFPHTVKAAGGGFESAEVDSGKAFTFRAVKKGDYPYICTLHPTMGGTLHVK